MDRAVCRGMQDRTLLWPQEAERICTLLVLECAQLPAHGSLCVGIYHMETVEACGGPQEGRTGGMAIRGGEGGYLELT